MGLESERAFHRYHRVPSRATWSSREASCVLLRLLVEAFVPDGPLVLGIDETPERAVAYGLMKRATPAQLEQLNLSRSWNQWKGLLGVALVVAVEMGMAWYFLRQFGTRILKTNAAIRIVLAASLTILFTALARFFIELEFNPYLTPLAGLSIIGTVLLGPRLTSLMVVITSVNVGIMSVDTFLTAALLLVSGFAIYTVARIGSRQALLKAGLVIAVVKAAVTSAVSLIEGGDFSDTLWLGAPGLGDRTVLYAGRRRRRHPEGRGRSSLDRPVSERRTRVIA
jgi:cyclic-di-AMP phosphodiesterase PgpH